MANINDNESTALSQNKMIAAYLNEGHTLTQLEALPLFGCLRLASRIHDLREKGMDIVSTKIIVPSGKTVCQYSIRKKEE